jgi:hypothetical protein
MYVILSTTNLCIIKLNNNNIQTFAGINEWKGKLKEFRVDNGTLIWIHKCRQRYTDMDTQM